LIMAFLDGRRGEINLDNPVLGGIELVEIEKYYIRPGRKAS